MKVNNQKYINNIQLKQLADEYEFFIWGVGQDGKLLMDQMKDYLKIIAFVDNQYNGEYMGLYPIIDMHELVSRMTKERKIIISTGRYAKEISEQLEERGFIEKEDYYIWDDRCFYHIDEDVASIIDFNREVWSEPKQENRKNQIIIPYENYHDVSNVVLAYCSQYLSEKYDADIYCYPRPWEPCGYETAWQVYKSFHAKKLLEPILDDEREKEAENIAKKAWNSIQKMEDWSKVNIFGINFGTTLIRDYLRHYVPYINPKDERLKPWFFDSVRRIVYWYDYFENNNVKAVIMWDGVHREGYLRDIAVTKGIPTYGIHYTDFRKMTLDYAPGAAFPYYADFWEQLTEDEQVYGIEWSKRRLAERLNGDTTELFYMHKNSPYAVKMQQSILDQNDNYKILICPHCFDDDPFFYGEQVFDNNLFEWLCHLGDLSEKTPQYDWYIKYHPNFTERDLMIMKILTDRYPRLKPISQNVSPIQLKQEGIQVALTVAGTIGHEYPLIGIPVINAGRNPHMAFGFNWYPKTKEAFDELIFNLPNIKNDFDVEEIYKFYCIHYLYYDWSRYSSAQKFFINPDLSIERDSFEKTGRNLGAWKYPLFIKEWTQERHEEIKQNVADIFKWLDEWQPNYFYKREIEQEEW